MKSEERHSLQTNELSKLAGKATFWFDKYYNQILWLAVIIMLALAGWMYWTRNRQVMEGGAWTELSSARTPEDLTNIPIKYPSTSAAGWARLQAASTYFDNSLHSAFVNREQANADLKRAREIYQSLSESKDTLPAVREQALMGLARSIESSSSGDSEPAVKAYEELLKAFPQTVYKKHAESRISELKKGSTQTFYAWYHKQNPKPPEQPKPDSKGPGSNLSVPAPGGLGAGPLGGLPAPPPPPSSSGTKGTDAPADAKTPEKPAAEKPKTETPAPKTSETKPTTGPQLTPASTPAQPTSEKPADKKPAPADAKATPPAAK